MQNLIDDFSRLQQQIADISSTIDSWPQVKRALDELVDGVELKEKHVEHMRATDQAFKLELLELSGTLGKLIEKLTQNQAHLTEILSQLSLP